MAAGCDREWSSPVRQDHLAADVQERSGAAYVIPAGTFRAIALGVSAETSDPDKVGDALPVKRG